MNKVLSVAQIQFSQALRATPVYRNYRKLADALERDQASINLLQDLIKYQQFPPTDLEKVEFDQEFQRSTLLLEFLEAERLMINEYNRLAEQYLNGSAGSCGGGCLRGCGDCQG